MVDEEMRDDEMWDGGKWKVLFDSDFDDRWMPWGPPEESPVFRAVQMGDRFDRFIEVKTNGEHIQHLSLSDLAQFIAQCGCDTCPKAEKCQAQETITTDSCAALWLEWLEELREE